MAPEYRKCGKCQFKKQLVAFDGEGEAMDDVCRSCRKASSRQGIIDRAFEAIVAERGGMEVDWNGAEVRALMVRLTEELERTHDVLCWIEGKDRYAERERQESSR